MRDWLVGAAGALWMTGAAWAATVSLRGSAEPMAVERAVVEIGGVRVTKPGGATSLLAWDQVRDLGGADPGTVGAEGTKELLGVAEDLWRARSRLQRGDLPAARPLFERHFDRFRGTTSETALVVAEGTLRCRLAGDDWMQAILPALETARLRKAGITTDRYAGLPPVLDDTTLLCPQLAPMWTVGGASEAIARSIESAVFTDSSVARLAAIYVALLRGGPPTVATVKDEPQGVAFLRGIALLLAGTPDQQQAAVKELSTLVRTLPEWTRAWANYAIGRSALQSTERAARIDGALALTRVAAQRGVPRRLVAESLDLAVLALQRLGDAEGAAALERERARLLGTTPRLAPPPPPEPAPRPPEEPQTAT